MSLFPGVGHAEMPATLPGSINSALGDNNTKILDQLAFEFALLQLEIEFVGMEPAKDLPDNLLLTLEVRIGDKDVIEINHDISR